MLNVINLFGGPGSGKSTTAAELFVLMKKAGMSVELVSEYAKDMVWEKRHNILTDQQYILIKQHRRLKRLEGQVEWAITDSPLPFSLVYMPPNDPLLQQTVGLTWAMYFGFQNHAFYLPRNPAFKFSGEGRTQKSATEASTVDERVMGVLPHATRYLSPNANYATQIVCMLNLGIVREMDLRHRLICQLRHDLNLQQITDRLETERSSILQDGHAVVDA